MVFTTVPVTIPHRSCDLSEATIRYRELGARVPTPGEVVTAHADGGGRAQELSVSVDAGTRDITVSADASATPVTASADTAAAYNACADGAHDWLGAQSDGARYYINGSTYPHSVDRTAWVTAINSAGGVWMHGRNRCGYPTKTNTATYLAYAGDTTRKAGINDSAICTGRDYVNVIHAGNLPGNIIGVECHYSTSTAPVYILEADIKFDGWDKRWTTSASSCYQQFDVWSSAAHEFGHLMGFDDLSEATSPGLTMSDLLGQCEFDARQMGKGDYDAWNIVYF